MRAVRFFPSLRDEDARAWLLTIVRNTWYSRVSRRAAQRGDGFRRDEATNVPTTAWIRRNSCSSSTPSTRVRAAIEQLPVDFREVLVLRELEGLSYKEIAAVIDAPIGTVMSRLARARERLLAVLKLSAMETYG